MVSNAIATTIMYTASAGSYGSIGTNAALGSPILNDSFSIEKWNKWEMVVWGIFLSNFANPFVDDYNSAFNLDSTYGSKGSGVKALEFGTGRDPANSKVIKDLLSYAVTQQKSGGYKQVYVSYNDIADGKQTTESEFSSDGLEKSNKATRAATLADLFFGTSDSKDSWIESTSDAGWFSSNAMFACDNYLSIAGIKNGSVPTFAVRDNSGSNKYNIVFDYTDSYDLGIIQLAITKAITGDFYEQAAELINNAANYSLYLDCFGNICAKNGEKYIVIVPASANQYLTTNKSINLVNSLMFNANSGTLNKEQIITNGGSSSTGSPGDLSGIPAFSNKFSGLNAGQPIIYFDTDTIIVQDIMNGEISKNNYDVYNISIGDAYSKLFGLEMGKANQKYAFKVEPANLSLLDYSKFNGDINVEHTISRANQLVNIFNTGDTQNYLNYIVTDTGNVDIFSDSYVVAVGELPGMNVNKIQSFVDGIFGDGSYKYNTAAVYRQFINFLYELWRDGKKSNTVGEASVDELVDALKSGSIDDIADKLAMDDNGNISNIMKAFIGEHSEFYNIKDVEQLSRAKYETGLLEFDYGLIAVLTTDGISGDCVDLKSEVMDDWFDGVDLLSRAAKVCTTSSVMTSVADVLGVREGTEFGLYSTWIYLTYLKWYGVTNTSLDSLNGVASSNLNKSIFDENSDILSNDISTITDVMSEEDKEAQIKEWTYLMLDPDNGREYRSNIMLSGLSDWIYNNYQKIVYGNASSYYDKGSGVTSQNSTGFLSVSSYSDNFTTAWFVGNYSYFSIYIVGIFFILIVVMGILRRMKISWYIVSILLMVNMILIIPATGEVVPLISNNFVQSIFSDKMSYWAISEGVTNAKLENEYITNTGISNSYLSGLSQEEQKQVISLVKNLNTLYLDRSLNIKQDISKKVTSTSTSNYEDVQQLASARWMLPMIMRQFTATDNSANYVYVPLGDLYDNLSNMYWYYEPTYAKGAKTVTSSQAESSDGSGIPVYNKSLCSIHDAYLRKNYYIDYDNHSSAYESEVSAYKQYSYENTNNLIHTYSYIIQENGLINVAAPKYSEYNSYNAWAKDYANKLINLGNTAALKTVEKHIEAVGGEYNRFDRGTIDPIYSYLWATENPLHYFYSGINDSISYSVSFGGLIGRLQGNYVTNESGEEVRKTFMHDNETGNVRDVLDLEEMFKNMIPYLYAVQLYAEGYDGVGGVFEDGDLIESYDIYTSNNKSWLFRSNWITKLMENEDYQASATIKLADGTKVKVANMMMPECYVEAGRDMIFSEAQMKAAGLSESDLSLVELKCVQINKDVVKAWTLLLNYAGVENMTREVMVRQMALEALIIFNNEFTPAGILNGAYAMYPNGIDLRAISFDSVMKMLMLNVTKDTSYIYGDTMKTIVEDSDIFTSILLLLTAFICVYAIPFIRNIVLGAIFFLGIWSILWSIFRDNKTKTKVSCGYVVSNIIMAVITVVYFAAFKGIMAMTTSDEVLSISSAGVSTGNPVWCLVFVLAISAIYCAAMYFMLRFCIKNYRDMGFEMYAGVTNMATVGITNAIDRLGSKIQGDGNGRSHKKHKNRSNRTSKLNNEYSENEGSNIENNTPDNNRGRNNGDRGGSNKGRDNIDREYEYEDSAYREADRASNNDNGESIEREIARGREIDRQEKAEKNKENKDKKEDNRVMQVESAEKSE